MAGHEASAGTITSLWRYPVKSMQGEELRTAPLGPLGVLGDRTFAIQEEASGMIASAKHPGKWSLLLECRAGFVRDPVPGAPLPAVQITLPDGSLTRSDAPDVDERLSAVFDRQVSLVRERRPEAKREADRSPLDQMGSGIDVRREGLASMTSEETFFDAEPLHLLTTATLAHLTGLYPGGSFDARRFRPNLLIQPEKGAFGFVEDAWLGRELAVGEAATLHVIDPCGRCVMTTLPQGELEQDSEILKTVHKHHAVASVTAKPGVKLDAVAGVYARVKEAGTIGVGDHMVFVDKYSTRADRSGADRSGADRSGGNG